MILEARKSRIAAMNIAEQEELFKDILVLTDTEELDTIMILIDLVYETGVVNPEQRRNLFRRLADWMIANDIGENVGFLHDILEEMMPRRFSHDGSNQLFMTTPYAYNIALCDYNRPKEEVGPDDPIFLLGINEVEAGEFTLNNLPQLKMFIQGNEHFDSLARNSYMDFIKKVEKRYK